MLLMKAFHKTSFHCFSIPFNAVNSCTLFSAPDHKCTCKAAGLWFLALQIQHVQPQVQVQTLGLSGDWHIVLNMRKPWH